MNKKITSFLILIAFSNLIFLGSTQLPKITLEKLEPLTVPFVFPAKTLTYFSEICKNLVSPDKNRETLNVKRQTKRNQRKTSKELFQFLLLSITGAILIPARNKLSNRLSLIANRWLMVLKNLTCLMQPAACSLQLVLVHCRSQGSRTSSIRNSHFTFRISQESASEESGESDCDCSQLDTNKKYKYIVKPRAVVSGFFLRSLRNFCVICENSVLRI